MSRLNLHDLENALPTRIWQTWYATTPLHVKGIVAGFFDDVMGNGLRTGDRVEVAAADGFVGIVIDAISSHGIGFSTLTMERRVQSFEAAGMPPHKKAPVKKKKKELPLAVMEFELTKEERQRGWTPESKAEYLEATESVKAVYVDEAV